MKYIDYRKQNFCNFQLGEGMSFSGEFDLPEIRPYLGDIPTKIIPFNQAITYKHTDCGVHFYIDDYQFERVWRQPEKYIPILKRFQCVIAPDFSVFLDTPFTANLWNIYRNNFLTAYFQQNGINVIPNMSVSFGKTKSASIDALPPYSVLSVSTIKSNLNYFTKRIFYQYIHSAISVKTPIKLLVYGPKIDIDTDIEISYFENTNITNLRKWNKTN